ncbi:hypothetical protein I6E29_08220 [Arcanobacterium haemolyticum]|nr:hypothetical protein [Arcanobacterium haemolyticum]
MHKNDPSGTRPGKRVANIALASALSTVLTFGTGAFMAGSAFAAPQSSVNMLTATDAALLPPTDDSNSVTVSTADELWNAIVQSDASVIKIAADIDLNTSTLTGAGDKSP